MQSQVTKKRNLEDVVDRVGSKLEAAPKAVTKEDASVLDSRTSRATDGKRPTRGSMAAQAQSLAAGNERGATAQSDSAAPTDPATQSQLDRVANYAEHADKVSSKLASNPESITKEDADKMHSKEQKAFGTTEKGGLASHAQSQVAENTGARNK